MVYWVMEWLIQGLNGGGKGIQSVKDHSEIFFPQCYGLNDVPLKDRFNP